MYLVLRRFLAFACIGLLITSKYSFGWGNDGHRIINKLAVETLPADAPQFLRNPEAVKEIEYLGPEPDRWRSRTEPELSAAQAPEHFLDLEPADALGPLPHNRFDFEALAFAHGQRPDKIGLQPWETLEVWERLKTAFREYRRIAAAKEDTYPVEQTAIFYAGWLGHYVGDGSQPLHTTIDYDGWVEKDNPLGFGTGHGIHARFETTFVAANLTRAQIEKKMTEPRVISGDVFDSYMAYLRHTATFVGQVYSFDKEGELNGHGTEASREFVAERVAAGASELRDLIYTAWIDSAQQVSGQSRDKSYNPSTAG